MSEGKLRLTQVVFNCVGYIATIEPPIAAMQDFSVEASFSGNFS